MCIILSELLCSAIFSCIHFLPIDLDSISVYHLRRKGLKILPLGNSDCLLRLRFFSSSCTTGWVVSERDWRPSPAFSFAVPQHRFQWPAPLLRCPPTTCSASIKALLAYSMSHLPDQSLQILTLLRILRNSEICRQ